MASLPRERGLSEVFDSVDLMNLMDTAKDARLLVLEDALRRLHETVGNRKLKLHVDYSRLAAALQKAGSLIYEIKYSYIPAPNVAELEVTEKLVDSISEFRSVLEEAIKSYGYRPSTINETLNLANVYYSFRIVERLKVKLQDFPDDPAFAVDILAVEVSKVQNVQDSKNLTECRCTDGTRIWKIVTNIRDIKPGLKLACAVLPPVEMMGSISEAMFLGGTPLPEDTVLGPMKNPPPSAIDQARYKVIEITKRMI
nr:MAG: hypothetical protein AM325_10340 [Candidatus Thorarchaeota archaeon SMTZ1-45]